MAAKDATVPRCDPFEFITEAGLLTTFDISEGACEVHGVFHGQRFLSKTGKFAGLVITVIGVSDDSLWVAADWSGAHKLQYSSDYKVEHGLQFLFWAPVLHWTPTSPCVLYSGKVYDTSIAVQERFGVQAGQRAHSPGSSVSGSVIGMRLGTLWLLSDLYKSVCEANDCVKDETQVRALPYHDEVHLRQCAAKEADLHRSFRFCVEQRDFCV